MDIANSIKELQEELSSRESLIEKLKETCINLKSQISTLRAAQIVMESRARSALYEGQSFKDIVLSETEKFGITTEDFVKDTYKGQNELIENLIQYLVYGTTIQREFREEVCVRASNLFEIDFNVLMNSLEVPVKSSIPQTNPVDEPKKEFLIPNHFGDRLKFYLYRTKLSREDLSKSMSVCSQTISNWCNNKNVPQKNKIDEVAHKLSNIFGSTSESEWKQAIEYTSKGLAKNKGAGH